MRRRWRILGTPLTGCNWIRKYDIVIRDYGPERGTFNTQLSARDFPHDHGEIAANPTPTRATLFRTLIEAKNASTFGAFYELRYRSGNGGENRLALAALRGQKSDPVNPQRLARLWGDRGKSATNPGDALTGA